MKLHNVEIQLKVQHKYLTSLILVPPQIPGVLFVAYIVMRRIDTRCSWSRPASGPASRLLRRKLNVGCFCWGEWVTTETTQTCKQNRWCRYRLEPLFPLRPPRASLVGEYQRVHSRRTESSVLLFSWFVPAELRRSQAALCRTFRPAPCWNWQNNVGPAVITPCSHNQVLISTNLCSLCGERLQHSRELLARAVRRCYWPAWLRINKPLFNSGVLCARGQILTMLWWRAQSRSWHRRRGSPERKTWIFST